MSEVNSSGQAFYVPEFWNVPDSTDVSSSDSDAYTYYLTKTDTWYKRKSLDYV